ncbi:MULTISPECIES: hypothetical protein [unclassified Devosia]|uniref:hypothetical protein n=1 Tax=unclassified Devosia TaxID=196773 RepID=UPI001AD54C1A|nr:MULTISPECIES: hypothetical protein [unclassified Devosia]MBN9304825.1 hypothetical protein [Devosia sp.]
MKTITIEELYFADAVKVISSAQKYIIPIPELSDGEPLIYPGGSRGKDGSLVEGMPIVDWQGNAIGQSGVVFYNGKDRAVQAARGDGSGVIIMNEVNDQQAKKLTSFIEQLAGTPEALSLAQIKAVLEMARGLGLEDTYNSDRGFVQSKMSPVGDLGADGFGLHKRDDRDICPAIRLTGEGTFAGPAATPQQFRDGAVIVRQGDNYRLIQSDVFERTYRHSDNSAVRTEELPVGTLRPSSQQKAELAATAAL